MENTQNTVAGIAGGSSLVPTNGSPFMDYLTGLVNLGGTALNLYGSFYESKTAADIAKKATEQAQQPKQTVPDYLLKKEDILNDPAKVQAVAIYVAVGALALGVIIWGIKKI